MAKAYQERLIMLVKDTITLLCKNGLEYSQEFSVEGLLGVTLDKDEVFLIPIKELVADKSVGTSASANTGLDEVISDNEPESTPARERRRKRKQVPVPETTESTGEGSTNVKETNEVDIDSDGSVQKERTQRDPTVKRRRNRRSSREDLHSVKEEDIVVIKEELDDEDFVSAYQDNSIDNNSVNPAENDMAYFGHPGTSQTGDFSLDQLTAGSASLDPLAAGSSMLGSIQQGIQGANGELSWLQDSQGRASGDWPSQRHQCSLCGKVFAGQYAYARHQKSVHLGQRHVCQVCGKEYVYSGDLARHRRKQHAHERSDASVIIDGLPGAPSIYHHNQTK